MYKKKLLLHALILSLVFLVGCDSGDDDDDAGTSGSIRFVNAITDSPQLLLYRDEGDVDDDLFVASAEYGHGSVEVITGAGTIDFVIYTLIDDELEDINVRFDATLNADTQLLIILYGTVDDVETLTVEVDDFDDDLDTSRVGVIGLSQNRPAVDVYLTTGNDGVFDSSVVLTANYGQFDGMVEMDDGEYNLILTEAGQQDRIYEAGEVDLDEDTNVVYAIVDTFGVAEDILVIEMADSGSSVNLIDQDDSDDPLAIRFVNGIPDNSFSSVDIYFGDTEGDPLFEGVEFTSATDYLELTVDADEFPDYDLNVTPHGVKDVFYYQRNLTLNRGSAYSLMIAGLIEDDDVGSSLVETDLREIDGQARFIFVHASPSNGDEVDIYLLGRGQPVDDGTPLNTGIDYLLSTQYLVESGDYDIYIVDSDNDVEILGPQRITLDDGENRTFYFVDRSGGGTPGELVEVDNKL